MSPNELMDNAKSFLEFCLKHPFISIPVAFILFLGLVGHFFETVKTFLEFVIKTQSRGSPAQKRLLWSGLALILLCAIASPFVAAQLSRPKPTILTKSGSLLAKDFVVAWDYKADEHKPTSYEVTVVDKNTPSGATRVYFSKTPYYRVQERGKLGIQVRAIAANWHSDPSDEVVVEVYTDSVERIRAKNQLVVAIHVDNSDGLFCFLNKTTNDYDGFDVDLINLIASKLQATYQLKNLNITTQYMTWPEIIDAPNTYEVDFSIASISITPERQKTILFSRPYLQTEVALMRYKDEMATLGNLVTPDELRGLTIGVHKGTTAVDFLRRVKTELQPSFEIKILNNNPELFAWLENRAISAATYDYLRTLAESASHPNLVTRRFNKDFQIEPERYGLAFSLLNERLRNDVDVILRDESGVIERAFATRVAAVKGTNTANAQ